MRKVRRGRRAGEGGDVVSVYHRRSTWLRKNKSEMNFSTPLPGVKRHSGAASRQARESLSLSMLLKMPSGSIVLSPSLPQRSTGSFSKLLPPRTRARPSWHI